MPISDRAVGSAIGMIVLSVRLSVCDEMYCG